MSSHLLSADAVRTAEWQPNKQYNQLFKHGHPLIQLPSGWSFDPEMKDIMHQMILLLNAAEPTVFFDWGEGWLADGPPYFVYYLGDYDLAKRAIEAKISELNNIWEPAFRAMHFRRDPKGEMWITGVGHVIKLSELIGANQYTIGQAWRNVDTQ